MSPEPSNVLSRLSSSLGITLQERQHQGGFCFPLLSPGRILLQHWKGWRGLPCPPPLLAHGIVLMHGYSGGDAQRHALQDSAQGGSGLFLCCFYIPLASSLLILPGEDRDVGQSLPLNPHFTSGSARCLESPVVRTSTQGSAERNGARGGSCPCGGLTPASN